MDFRIPLVGKGVTLTEIPDHISVYFEIGGCVQQCHNCHSLHHQERGDTVDVDYVVRYAIHQAEHGATACVLMGGTTSKYLSKQNLAQVINRLSPILPVGLYSGAEVDDYFMSNKNLRWYKAGAYVEALGGLAAPTTNQQFYQRDKDGEWVLANGKFQ